VPDARTSISAACAGFAAMVAQLLLARELMVVCLGDELTVGLVLFAWLFWVGAGSAAGGVAAGKYNLSESAAGKLLVLQGVLLPVSLAWARVQGLVFGYHPGELVPVGTVLVMAMAALGPVCLATGLLFPVLCRSAAGDGNRSVSGKVYALDTLGSVAGGLGFSLVMVALAGPEICSLAAGAAAAGAGVLWLRQRARRIATGVILALIVSAPLWLGPASRATRVAAWGPQFRFSVDSGYGNITVLKEKEQYSLFASGRFAGTVPDSVFGEYVAHVPLLAHPGPKTAMLAGGSARTVKEMLKHGLEKITYVELDPRMLELKKRLAPAETAAVFEDPAVRTAARDPRLFLAEDNEKYDVIIVAAGSPENLQLNRYYTLEFLKILELRLAPGGIAAITVPFSENYTGPEERTLLGSIVETFRETGAARPFLVPGPKSFLLWEPGGELSVTSAEAAARFDARDISSRHFNADSAAYYFDSNHIESALSQFAGDPLEFSLTADKQQAAFDRLVQQPGTMVNTDTFPVCVYYETRLNTSYYTSRAGDLLKAIERAVRGRHAMPALAAVSALFLVCGFLPGRPRRAAAAYGVAAAGLLGILVEIVLLLEFQAVFGVVYQYLGVIIAAFMGGTAAGAALGSVALDKSGRWAGLYLAIALAALALLPAGNMYWIASGTPESGPAAIFAWSFAAGACVGWLFPWAVRASMAGGEREAGRAGTVYAADLAGSCIGAVVTAAVLVPAAGLEGALGIAAFLGASAAAAFAGTMVAGLRGKL